MHLRLFNATAALALAASLIFCNSNCANYEDQVDIESFTRIVRRVLDDNQIENDENEVSVYKAVSCNFS